jgi:acetyl-CoA synthetase
MSNLGRYPDRVSTFDWGRVRAELGWREGQPINIGWMCTDRICNGGQANKTALVWQNAAGNRRQFSFDDLRRLSDSFASGLKDLGIQPGDRVGLYMDRIPQLYVGTLAILKLGAIAQPLFSAFMPDSLHVRLADAGTRAVLTTKRHLGKLRQIRAGLPRLERVLVVDGGSFAYEDGELDFCMDTAATAPTFRAYPATTETPSLLHYTSGTTGKPKGAQHSHGSILQQYITAKWVLDLQPDDIYWCTADPGWVTGTSYGIIGPWVNGTTQVVLDAGFSARSWYALVAEHRVTVWYSAPTAIRMLMKEGLSAVKEHDLSSLRHLCSVGEPLNPEAVIWSREAFGVPFHDTFWQTETGAIMIANYPGVAIKPGSMGLPFPGIRVALLDPETKEPTERAGKVGLIAFQPGWPSMLRGYWNDEATFRSKFANGWYNTGDRATRDEDGYYWFVGRDDDVINTGGHLVGPFEIESALLEHPAVAEAAAVGIPDPVNLEAIKAFVALKPGHQQREDLDLELMNFIRRKLSAFAMPKQVEFVDSLPKTRSGKIMRRMLRAKEWGQPVGDTSTLEDNG